MEASDEHEARATRAFYEPASTRRAAFEFRFMPPKDPKRSPTYRVLRRFDYVDYRGDWFRVPVDVADNATDLASIPSFLTWLVPKDGSHTPAAVLHDALIGGTHGVDYESSTGTDVSDRHADYLFREAMAASGVSWLRRWIMWAAVALRTLTVHVERGPSGVIQKPDYRRIVPVAAIVLALAVLSTGMALDVPDLLDDDLPRWFGWIEWLGDRPWYEEIGLGLAFVAVSGLAAALVFSVALGIGRRAEAFQRGAAAGAIGGVLVGFLGLPMVASLVGAVGYRVLDRLAALRYPDRVAETAGVTPDEPA